MLSMPISMPIHTEHANNEQSEEEIMKKKSIYNSIKENKILRNTLNQGYERHVHCKL